MYIVVDCCWSREDWREATLKAVYSHNGLICLLVKEKCKENYFSGGAVIEDRRMSTPRSNEKVIQGWLGTWNNPPVIFDTLRYKLGFFYWWTALASINWIYGNAAADQQNMEAMWEEGVVSIKDLLLFVTGLMTTKLWSPLREPFAAFSSLWLMAIKC